MDLNEGMEKLLNDKIKLHWIWLASLIAIYNQHNKDEKANDFWNFMVNYYKPEGVDEIK